MVGGLAKMIGAASHYLLVPGIVPLDFFCLEHPPKTAVDPMPLVEVSNHYWADKNCYLDVPFSYPRGSTHSSFYSVLFIRLRPASNAIKLEFRPDGFEP